MDNDLKELILARASKCTVEYCTRKDIDYSEMKVVKIEKPAKVWGDNVLSWEFQGTTDSIKEPLLVEVSIDRDGYVSANVFTD